GMPHANVAQDGIAQIEGQVRKDGTRPLLDLKFHVPSQSRDCIRGQRPAGRDVGAAFAQFQSACGLIRYHGEAHALDTGSLAPIILITINHHLAVEVVGYEAERTGANRVGAELLIAAERDNAERSFRQVVEQSSVGFGKVNHQCPVIGRVDALDQLVGGGFESNERSVAYAVERPLDVARSQRTAVVETNVAAQVEDVGAQIRSFPAFGDPGTDHEVLVTAHQRVE